MTTFTVESSGDRFTIVEVTSAALGRRCGRLVIPNVEWATLAEQLRRLPDVRVVSQRPSFDI